MADHGKGWAVLIGLTVSAMLAGCAAPPPAAVAPPPAPMASTIAPERGPVPDRPPPGARASATVPGVAARPSGAGPTNARTFDARSLGGTIVSGGSHQGLPTTGIDLNRPVPVIPRAPRQELSPGMPPPNVFIDGRDSRPAALPTRRIEY